MFANSSQVVRRYILGSVVDSEKNYVDALKRILEVPECHVTESTQILLTFLRIVFLLHIYVYIYMNPKILKFAKLSEAFVLCLSIDVKSHMICSDMNVSYSSEWLRPPLSALRRVCGIFLSFSAI